MNRKDSLFIAALAVAALVAVTLTYKLTVLQGVFGPVDFHALSGALCGDEPPTLFGLFDINSAPGLVFYTYLPLSVMLIVVGLVLRRRRNSSTAGMWLSATLFFYAMWLLSVLAEWLASYHTVLMFSWQIIAIAETGTYLCGLGYLYTALFEKDMPFWAKSVLWTLGMGVIAATPTVLNIASYSEERCVGIEGPLWTALYYGVQPLVLLTAIVLGVRAVRAARDPQSRSQRVLLAGSFIFFFVAFLVANLIGEATNTYELNLWGPVGLALYLLCCAYLVVRRRGFHRRLIIAVLMVWMLVTLVGVEFFFIDSTTQFLMNCAAFVATVLSGLMLVRAANVEVRMGEEAEAMRRTQARLQKLLIGTVKTALFAHRGEPAADAALLAVSRVQRAHDAKRGDITANLSSVDLRAIAQSVAEGSRPDAERKGLALTTELGEESAMVFGDQVLLREVLHILLDNAVRYTAVGGITVGLSRVGGSARLWVRDTGPGIPDTDKAFLFSEGGHGADTERVNPEMLGLGLYTAKLLVEQQHGRIWAESTGPGSTFFVEIPLIAG